MKKFLSLVLVLAMVLAVAACSGVAEGKKLVAGMVFQEDQFFKMLAAGYAGAASEYGYDIMQTNTNNDQSKETDALNTYVNQGVAGVAISPLSTSISPASVEDANKEGLAVSVCNAAIDSFPCAVAAFSADNVAFCKQTGEAAVAFIQANFEADRVLKVGIVQYKAQVPEQSAERVKGFFTALDEAGVKYEVVADQDAWLQDMAVSKAGDMISANPDLDIIFSANDGGTVGTVMAVENAGKAGQIFVFGTDGSEQIVSLLKDETNILQAVTAQDAYAIGYNTMKALIQSLEGEEVEGAGQTNIVPGIPLVRGNDAELDAYLEMLASMK